MPFADDFNRADSATVGNDWIERDGAYWDIYSNQLRWLGGGNYRTVQCYRPTSENFANGTISVEFVRTATDTAPHVQARANVAGPTFYTAYILYSTLYIAKVVNNTKTSLGSQVLSTIANGTAYKLTFVLNGTSLSAQVHRVSDSVLMGELAITDSAISAAGQHGVCGDASATDILFDNFYSSILIDATKAVTDDGAGTDAVTALDTSNSKNTTDSGTGADSLGIAATVPLADTGQGAEGVAITVFVGVGDTGTGGDSSAIAQQPMLSLLERFDGTLDAWMLDTGGGTAQIQTVNNDEKLVLNDTSGSALVSATRSIEGQFASYCVEVDIYVGTGAIGFLEALDAANNVVFSIKADAGTGQGTFDTDNDTPSTFTLTAATYYQIVFYCDTLAGTVAAWYITGGGGAPSNWIAIGAAKNYGGASVSKIRLSTDATATGEARFDEVKVFRPHIFCIGDSNTAGYKSATPYWNPVPSAAQRVGVGEDETHSYPHWLGLKYSPVRWVANRGLNSDQSSHVDGRIQTDVIDQGATCVVILIGTNDITASVPLGSIEANIQSAASKAALAGLAVCLCSVPPRNAWNSTQNATRSSLNAWIQSHCTANGYSFADVYNAVKNPANPNQLDPAYDAGDGVHFLTAGLQVIADTVYAALLNTEVIFDSGSGVDFVDTRRLLTLAESGGGSDGIGMSGTGDVSIVDAGSAAEAIAIYAIIQMAENGAGIEGLVAGDPSAQPKLVTDGGSALDNVVRTILSGATVQDIYDLVQGQLVTGIAALQLDSAFLIAIIRNKRYLQKVGTTWYLVVRNDDDTGDMLRKPLKGADGVTEYADLQANALGMEVKSVV